MSTSDDGPAYPVPAFTELLLADAQSTNPLQFPGYHPPAGDDESVVAGFSEVLGQRLMVIQSRFDHMGGTMGAVSGQRIVAAFDAAARAQVPVVALVASGGARLQEGMISLIQMGRTASAVERFRSVGQPFIAVLRAHTTGGVYASWASLADVIAAERGATIGFGGPRVVATVTGAFPPPDSHTAESAYAHGLVDALVDRDAGWQWASGVLFGHGARVDPSLPAPSLPTDAIPADPWQVLLRARSPRRPSGVEWANLLCEEWTELRGPDASMRAALVRIEGQRMVAVVSDRHSDASSATRPGPDAYRLTQRALAVAERLRLPVLTIIDTPGSEPGPAAEADGIAGEIARTLRALAALSVPSVALCVGEGGSGGAMAFAHTDRLFILDGAVFEVIGPEAGAVVLYRDASRQAELARAFALTAPDLLRLGIVDAVLPEGDPGAVRAAILDAVATAVSGDRDLRTDAVTAANLTGPGPSAPRREPVSASFSEPHAAGRSAGDPGVAHTEPRSDHPQSGSPRALA